MLDQARILVFGEESAKIQPILAALGQQASLVRANRSELIGESQKPDLEGVLLVGEESLIAPFLFHLEGVLKFLPVGVCVVDAAQTILWSNERLKQIIGRNELSGVNFYEALGEPELQGPDFSPFHTALATGRPAHGLLKKGEKTFYEILVAHIAESDDANFADRLVVTITDVSAPVSQRQKLEAIYQAGANLASLTPEELAELSVEDRKELIKQQILMTVQETLQFETIEIRLLDPPTGKLEPLLNVGMSDEAALRVLYALPEGNGVTGFVAATGQSYLCDDTSRDSLYLSGAPGAHSSLTVPLIVHDQILGTVNVERSEVGGFTQHDLRFLQVFCRDVAAALNTLDLLAAEKKFALTATTELLLREVARPVDEILNDTVSVLERYIGHDPDVAERLQRVLKHTRTIRQMIHKLGEESQQPGARTDVSIPANSVIRNKRILVVDSDEQVRLAAHQLLGRFRCEVDTAHNGAEARAMVRTFHYDAVIADIRLPDMNGYECYCAIREQHEFLPVVLMTGYGYDAAHSIVKARQAGLKSVLYKPFRLEQLLTELEKALAPPKST